jgi:hypothetical protein
MSKAPKRPSQGIDLRWWDNQGGAPCSGHPSHEPHPPPSRTPSGIIDDPKGEAYLSLGTARKDALVKARDMIVEGNQKGEDRHDWSFETTDRADQPVLTVAFSEIVGPKIRAPLRRRKARPS